VSTSKCSDNRHEVTAIVSIVKGDEARLRAAGFVPVVRWVNAKERSDEALKTLDALIRVERGKKKGK
jgi:hypothetical protein